MHQFLSNTPTLLTSTYLNVHNLKELIEKERLFRYFMILVDVPYGRFTLVPEIEMEHRGFRRIQITYFMAESKYQGKEERGFSTY